jgi:hypothetical protein
MQHFKNRIFSNKIIKMFSLVVKTLPITFGALSQVANHYRQTSAYFRKLRRLADNLRHTSAICETMPTNFYILPLFAEPCRQMAVHFRKQRNLQEILLPAILNLKYSIICQTLKT